MIQKTTAKIGPEKPEKKPEKPPPYVSPACCVRAWPLYFEALHPGKSPPLKWLMGQTGLSMGTVHRYRTEAEEAAGG